MSRPRVIPEYGDGRCEICKVDLGQGTYEIQSIMLNGKLRQFVFCCLDCFVDWESERAEEAHHALTGE